MIRHLLLGFCLILGACAADAARRDGFVLKRKKSEEMLDALMRRATFDFNCPADRLSLTILEVHNTAGPDLPKQVGVMGCEKRATYSREFLHLGGGPGMTWDPRTGRQGILWGTDTIVDTGWKLDGAGIMASPPEQFESARP
jgi:hypothetical protein